MSRDSTYRETQLAFINDVNAAASILIEHCGDLRALAYEELDPHVEAAAIAVGSLVYSLALGDGRMATQVVWPKVATATIAVFEHMLADTRAEEAQQ